MTRIILQDGKSKVFHANILKKYEDREQIMAVSVVSSSVPGEEQLLSIPEVTGTESVRDVRINPDLSTDKR